MNHLLKVLAALVICIAACSAVHAQVPRTLSLQGVLTSPGGQPVADGNHPVLISLYTAATGGAAVYTETQTVPTAAGVFNIIIGSVTPIPANLFNTNGPSWVGLAVDGGAELTPRIAMASSPYSLHAGYAETAASALSIAPNATGLVRSLNGGEGDMTIVGSGGTTITRNGTTITVSSTTGGGGPAGVQGIQNTDGTLLINNPNGPSTTINIASNGITNDKIAPNTITTDKILNGTVSSQDIADGAIDNNKLATDAVSTVKIANQNVTGPKLADGAVSTLKILDGAVTTAKIADGSVTAAKIAPGTIPTTFPPSGPAGGDLAGTYPNPTIGTAKVTGAHILDGTITNIDVNASAAIAYSKLNLANSIVTGDLTDGSVTLPKLSTAGSAAGQGITYNGTAIVWGSPSPGGAAGGDLTGTYPSPTIGVGKVTSSHILDGTIVNADVSPTAAIAYSKLALTNSIVTTDLTDLSVSTQKLQDQSVTLPKINIISAVNGQAVMYNGSLVVWGNPSPGGAAGGDLTGTYPNPTIGVGKVTSSHILDGTIVNADVSPTAAIAYSKLALGNSIVTGDIVDGTIVNADVSPTAAIAYSKLALASSIVSGDIVDGTIVNADVSPTAAIAYSKLALTNSLVTGDLTDGSVTSAKILDGTIVNADVSPTAAIAYSKLALTNSIVAGDLTTGSVTSAKILDGEIVNADINVAAGIAYSKLALASSIVSGDIVDGTIVNADVSPTAAIAYSKLNLTNSLVTADHIDASITLPKLSPTGAASGQAITYNGASIVWGSPSPGGAAGGDLTGTFPNPTIAANAVTSAKILDGTIVDADVSPTAAIAYSKLNLVNSIQNADIVANAITTSKVANGTVTTSKLADSAVSGLKLLTAAVNTAHIADGAVTDAKVANGISYSKLSGAPTSLPPSGAAGGDLTGTYPNPVIAANAVTSAKIADGSITNADLSAAAAISYSKLNLSGSIVGSDVAAGTFTTTNAHIAIGNNDNTARELRLLEASGSGVNYTAVKAQAQAADITLTLPNAAPTAVDQVLQVQAVAGNNATLKWGAIGGGAILFSRTGLIANAGNTSYSVVGSDDIIGIDMSAGTNFTVNLQPATTAGEILIIKIEKYNNALLPVLTLLPNGTDKINGNNSEAFGNAGGNRRLYSDGAGNWYSW